jgi:hypothetical protein
LLPAVFAAESGDTFTDPKTAGFDLRSRGNTRMDESAAQVIALGDGKFHIVGWTPSLPGVPASRKN